MRDVLSSSLLSVLRCGRVAFIYDTEACRKEEDDPADAVCFFHASPNKPEHSTHPDSQSEHSTHMGSQSEHFTHPGCQSEHSTHMGSQSEHSTHPTDQSEGLMLPTGQSAIVSHSDSDDYREAVIHLISQLVGAATFLEWNLSFPSFVRLQMGYFCLYKEEQFIWGLYSSSEDSVEYVTRLQLTRTRQLFCTLHGGLATALSRLDGNRTRFYRLLANTLPALLSPAPVHHVPPSLHAVFYAPPRLDWSQKDESIAHELCQLTDELLSLPAVLHCVFCWDDQVLHESQDSDMVPLLYSVSRLPVSMFSLHEHADMVTADSLLAEIHLETMALSLLMSAARERRIVSDDGLAAPADDEATAVDSDSEAVTDRVQRQTATANGADSAKVSARVGDKECRLSPERVGVDADAGECRVDGEMDGADECRVVVEQFGAGDSETRRRIGALALQAISAECRRVSPERAAAVQQIPLRPLPRRRRRRCSLLNSADVPSPSAPRSDLACLRGDRSELRRRAVRLCDNEPVFVTVPCNAYSFGVPRSNRIYTPRRRSDTALLSAFRTPLLFEECSAALVPEDSQQQWGHAAAQVPADSQQQRGHAAAPAPEDSQQQRGHAAAPAPEDSQQQRGHAAAPAPEDSRQQQLGHATAPAPEDSRQQQLQPALLYVLSRNRLRVCVALSASDTPFSQQLASLLDRWSSSCVTRLSPLLSGYRCIPGMKRLGYSYASFTHANGSHPNCPDIDAASGPDPDCPDIDSASGPDPDCPGSEARDSAASDLLADASLERAVQCPPASANTYLTRGSAVSGNWRSAAVATSAEVAPDTVASSPGTRPSSRRRSSRTESRRGRCTGPSDSCWRPTASAVGSCSARLRCEGAARLDSRLVQLTHADLAAGRFSNVKLRSPVHVIQAQRCGNKETFYQRVIGSDINSSAGVK